MSTTNNGSGEAAPAAATTQPQMNVLGQYIKDFSFENPNAPHGAAQQPSINIQFNIAPRQLTPTDYEVELKIEGKAEAQGNVLFAFDLSYAGMFRLQNIPQEHIAPILMIECPRLLFPFSREIIASTTVQSGFPPLLLEPIDFAAMYQQRMAQQAQPTAQA